MSSWLSSFLEPYLFPAVLCYQLPCLEATGLYNLSATVLSKSLIYVTLLSGLGELSHLQ